MTRTERNRKNPYARNIQWERQSLFVEEVQPRMIASGLGAALLGALMIHNLSAGELITWLVLCAFVSVFSHFLLARQREVLGRVYEADRPYRLLFWHRINLLIAIIWGAMWSIAPWFFLNDADQSQVFTLVLFIVVMSAMPSVSTGTYPDIYLLFVIPVFASLFILLWPTSTPLLLTVVALSGVSLGVFSLATHKSQMNSIELRLAYQLAQKHAKEADQAKSRFLAAASHDLRQPLQAAYLYLHVMQRHSKEPDELLSKAVASVSSANDLLTKLLDTSLIDADVVNATIQSCDLQTILQSLAEEFDGLASEKGLTLTVAPAPIFVMTDSVLFTQILRNLLGNAIKYTNTGSVSVSIELRGDLVKLHIEDTGPGIEPAEQADVFKEFYRAKHMTNAEPGIGLGLSIVQRLCDQLNIDLHMDSIRRKGTTFTLTLAVSLQKPAPLVSTEISLQLPAQFVAIVVDNSEEVRDALSATLVEWNGDVWTAAEYFELKAMLPTMPSAPDLLLTDDMLSDEHRSNHCIQAVLEYFPNTACVVLTGNTSLGGIQRLSNAQWPVLHKPIDSCELKATISKLLSSKVNS